MNLPRLLLLTCFLSSPAMSDIKTLTNDMLKDKGYERLEGDSQFRMGCRYLIRSEDRTLIFTPTAVSGLAIAFNYGDIFYAVYYNDKSALLGSDGGMQTVTTWRTCAVL